MIHQLKLLIIASVFSYSLFAQEAPWKGYFSYENNVAITEGDNGVIVATENALFFTDIVTGDITTKTTLDGLSGLDISTVYYSKSKDKTVIGYVNGLIQIIGNDAVFDVVDIQDKLNINPTKKRINHFYEFENRIYISCDFGISVFDLEKLVFVDTYLIGDSGTEIKIVSTTINNSQLYAATAQNGIKTIHIDNPAIVDFSQWNTLLEGVWFGVETFSEKVIAYTADRRIMVYDGINISVAGEQEASLVVNSSISANNLVVTTPESVVVYDQSFTLIKRITPPNSEVFTDAVFKNNHVFICTQSKGLLDYNINADSFSSNVIKPAGPSMNSIFSMEPTSDNLWVVYGDYNSGYNPYPLDEYNVSSYSYNSSVWNDIEYSKLLDSKSIVRVIANPNDESHVFFSSYFSGLLEVKDGNVVKLHNEENSGLESLEVQGSPDYIDIRINGSAYGAEGGLWLTNSLIGDGLKELKSTGEWGSYTLDNAAPFDSSYGDIVIDKNNTKWIASNNEGLLGYNEKLDIPLRKISVSQNLEVNDVRSVAVANDDKLWIGTTSGLRILNDVDQFVEGKSLNTELIVINDGGIGQELLREQFISDIIVDGANKKWLATVGAGLFYVSSTGLETIYHFTSANSPLPSDNINDIAINDKTGELFIATDKGMVSFMTNITESNEDLSRVFVYPNPVRPGYTGMINITGLIDGANVKITDVTGNLVHQAAAEGGTVQWDGTAFGQHQVATGVYLVFVSASSGETQTKKIMIVR